MEEGSWTMNRWSKRFAEISDAVDKKARIIFDGGIMRGTDVLKAIALGADCVGIGRLAFAAAAGGANAILRMLELLETEILTGMRLLGLNSLSQLDHTYISKDYAFDTKDVLSAFPLSSEGY